MVQTAKTNVRSGSQYIVAGQLRLAWWAASCAELILFKKGTSKWI